MGRLSSTTVRIGDTAPSLALFALDERLLMLADLLQETAVLVVFAPGAWSPGTRRQMDELSAAHELFGSMGLAVVMVITQDARSLRRRYATSMPPFPVLADERGEAARDYGIYRALSWDGLGVTRPAAFAIDQTGCIRFIYVGGSHHDVPETEALLLLALWIFGQPAPEAIAEMQAEAEAEVLAEVEAPSGEEVVAEVEAPLGEEVLAAGNAFAGAAARPESEAAAETETPAGAEAAAEIDLVPPNEDQPLEPSPDGAADVPSPGPEMAEIPRS
jgi:peroxiredoxin